MLLKFSRFLAIASLISLTCALVKPAKAQVNNDNVVTIPPLNINVVRPGPTLSLEELANEAFSHHTRDIFEQSDILGQFNFLFGWSDAPEGSYTENDIMRDSHLLYVIYDDYFRQLNQREPTMRTRDINNPFNTSVRQSPSYMR